MVAMNVKYKNQIYWLDKDGETVAAMQVFGKSLSITRWRSGGDIGGYDHVPISIDELTALLRAMGWTVEPPTVA